MNQMNFGLHGCTHLLRANLPMATAQLKQVGRSEEKPAYRPIQVKEPNDSTQVSSYCKEA